MARAAVVFAGAMAYLFISDAYRLINDTTPRWTTSVQATWAYAVVSVVFLVWGLVCALTVDGGPVDHVPDARGKDKKIK